MAVHLSHKQEVLVRFQPPQPISLKIGSRINSRFNSCIPHHHPVELKFLTKLSMPDHISPIKEGLEERVVREFLEFFPDGSLYSDWLKKKFRSELQKQAEEMIDVVENVAIAPHITKKGLGHYFKRLALFLREEFLNQNIACPNKED